MKSVIKVVLPVLILLISAVVFMQLKASRPDQPPAEVSERVWRVEVLEVEPGELAPVLTLYGRVETPSLYRAAAPLSSRVERVLVREGELVRAGQLLIELDARDFQPAVAQAEAEVTELEAQLRSEQIRQASDLEALEQERRLLQLSRQSLERSRRLQKQKLGSDSELDLARQDMARQRLSLTSRERSISDHPARVEALEAKLKRAEARLATARLNFERSRVNAPYAGRIAKLDVAAGNQVAANQQLLTLYDPVQLELRARIPEPFLDELERNQEQGAVLQGFIVRGGRRFDLRFSRLAGESAPGGTDALFVLQQPGTESWLRTGQVLSFRLQRQVRADALAVPHSVLYGGDRVYKLKDGRLHSVKVEALGNYTSDDGEERLLIRSDRLKRGDRLVLTHLPNATEGLRVETTGGQ